MHPRVIQWWKLCETGLATQQVRNTREYVSLLWHSGWASYPGQPHIPAQRFLAPRCKTLLPAHGALLKPQYSTEGDTEAISKQKERQQHYYDMHTKPLKPLSPGDSVRMQLPGQKAWSPGVCAGLVGPRSYEVKVGDRTFVQIADISSSQKSQLLKTCLKWKSTQNNKKVLRSPLHRPMSNSRLKHLHSR